MPAVGVTTVCRHARRATFRSFHGPSLREGVPGTPREGTDGGRRLPASDSASNRNGEVGTAPIASLLDRERSSSTERGHGAGRRDSGKTAGGCTARGREGSPPG